MVMGEVRHPNHGIGEPTEVKVRYVVLDIDGVDSAVQNFTMNLFFRAEWKDPREAHNEDGSITKSLSEIWHPNIQITNRQKIFKTLDPRAVISQDGTVNVTQRVWGNFSQIFDLKDFPFDSQKFEVTLVSVGHSPEEVKFVLDKAKDKKSGISPKFSLPDWEILGHEAWGFSESIFDGMQPASMFRISLEAKRYNEYYLLKVILPLFLIVAMSWIVFWIDPEQAGTQIGVATTSMLTLIAYRFSIDSLVPAVPYLTRMDAFILSSTLLVFATLGEAVLTSVLTKHGRPELAVRMDRWCRVIVPIGFLTLAVQVFLGQ
ncbi:hypothetical protein ACFSW8_16980 [Rubritalea tangerina]|uniref:Neurotransmitter-gated ion-channel ligand-binding domain-containing protein n=2 Tax=Rubritalea tangerina TaxID=430798 RepID=A0ABW4ZG71_9BACT